MEALQIRDEHGRIVPMKFSESQNILWQHVAPRLAERKKLWFIVLKGRQVYASTFFESLIFTRTIEQPGTKSLILAQDLDTSHEIFDMAKRFYEYLPLPKLIPPRVKELAFPFPAGVSKFKVVSAGIAAKGSGTTQTCVHCSEVAKWPQPEVLTSLFQTIPDVNDTIWILESTANGKKGIGRLFYKEWQRAIAGESDLVPIFIPWFTMMKYMRKPGIEQKDWDEEEQALVANFNLTPEQLAWRRFAIQTKCQGLIAHFHQEYPSTPEEAFVSSGMPAFESTALMRLRRDVEQPMYRMRVDPDAKKMTNDRKGPIRVWREPVPNRKYVIGADTSEGIVGGDYACAEVLDMKSMEQVACIHGLVPPYDFALYLALLGKWYNDALLAVEVNNMGHTVQDHLIRTFQYGNLHPWRGMPDKISFQVPRVFGWETNVHSRPLMIESGQRAVNKCLVTIHEEKLFDELADFSRNDRGKYEAEAGNDDRVIAFLVALRSREENYFEDRKPITPSTSEQELPGGVRIVEGLDDLPANVRKRTARILSQKAKDAVKSWLQL